MKFRAFTCQTGLSSRPWMANVLLPIPSFYGSNIATGYGATREEAVKNLSLFVGATLGAYRDVAYVDFETSDNPIEQCVNDGPGTMCPKCRKPVPTEGITYVGCLSCGWQKNPEIKADDHQFDGMMGTVEKHMPKRVRKR